MDGYQLIETMRTQYANAHAPADHATKQTHRLALLFRARNSGAYAGWEAMPGHWRGIPYERWSAVVLGVIDPA